MPSKNTHVLAWNIRFGGQDRIPKILKALLEKSPDVIVLTEYQSDGSLSLINSLQQHGWKHPILSKPPERTGGVAILSKYPLETGSTKVADFAWRYVHVVVPALDLEIVGIYGPADPPENAKNRAFWRGAVDALKEISGRNVLIIGDFNTGEPLVDRPVTDKFCSGFFNELKTIGYTDLWRHLAVKNAREHTWLGRVNPFRLDHGFGSPSIVNRLKGCDYSHVERETCISDHSMLSVILGGKLKIGTWNLDGKWKSGHKDILLREECDVWLLTEVPESVHLDGFERHLSKELMPLKGHYAGVFSRRKQIPLDDPHPASATVIIDGVTFCSSVLPCAGPFGNLPLFTGTSLAEKTANTLSSLLAALSRPDLVWGGDLNQNLIGEWENVGSNEGRNLLNEAIKLFDLQVPTGDLMHQKDICHAIDHIAVPSGWQVIRKARIEVEGLSDHDAYVIEAYKTQNPNRWISENAHFRWVNEDHTHGHDLEHWLDAKKEFLALE